MTATLVNNSKQAAELAFWTQEIARYVHWLYGSHALYAVPTPTMELIVRGDSQEETAILTWAAADRDKYLHHLKADRRLFDGKVIVDVGCGPLPLALAFEGCTIIGLDEQIDNYKAAGYPLHKCDKRMTYLSAKAEAIPLPDSSVDAVISVNALDHVEDFAAAAHEIQRILKPGGVVLIEVHYHTPTETEPLALSDSDVLSAFNGLAMRKVSQTPHSLMGTLNVWTNLPCQ